MKGQLGGYTCIILLFQQLTTLLGPRGHTPPPSMLRHCVLYLRVAIAGSTKRAPALSHCPSERCTSHRVLLWHHRKPDRHAVWRHHAVRELSRHPPRGRSRAGVGTQLGQLLLHGGEQEHELNSKVPKKKLPQAPQGGRAGPRHGGAHGKRSGAQAVDDAGPPGVRVMECGGPPSMTRLGGAW
jgi:hypothetical protein